MPTRTKKQNGHDHVFHAGTVLGLLIAFRIVDALATQTFFQPDEYFQSLEPAWQIAFGQDSGAWLTWEWRERLRSSLHPLLFAGVLKATSVVAIHLHVSLPIHAEMLLAAPKTMQALFAASMDYFTWELSQRIYGANNSASLATLALTVASPWNWFCGPRTLSNCLETFLTSAALYYWPFEAFISGVGHLSGTTNRLRGALSLAALATVLRPTNVMIWVVVALASMLSTWRNQHSRFSRTLVLLLKEIFGCGTAILVLSSLADKEYFKQWTFPPLRFIQFNIVQSLAVFYGQNRTDYYFTEGLPLLLTTALPFAVVGLLFGITGDSRPSHEDKGALSRQTILRTFTLTCLTMIIALTCISHKEVRFIYPLLPMLHILGAGPIAIFFSPFPRPRSIAKKALLAVLLAFNIALAAYISFVHQRGVIDVLHHLRHEYESHYLQPTQTDIFDPKARNMTVGFMMPCHSTPWRSHLVYSGIKAWALTCEPPIGVPIAERGSYLDEADQFYAGPTGFLKSSMMPTTTIERLRANEQSATVLQAATGDRAWPENLVFFQQLEPLFLETLAGTTYEECWRGFNSHFHDDWRRKGDVIVWCLRP